MSGVYGKVDTDDFSYILFESDEDAMGSIEVSRIATGSNDDIVIEIHGQKGAIKFKSIQPNFLEFYDCIDSSEPIGGERGFRLIETFQRYPEPATFFPIPFVTVGWVRTHIGNVFDFISNIIKEKKPEADFETGLKVQEILQAAIISDKENKWVELPL